MISGWSACRRRIEDGFRALRKRGQSETLGVALLTGVVLILVAVVGLFLFADFGANDEEQLLANIDGDVEATNITLSHEGGDEFAPGEIEVVLTGDVSRELRLNESFDATTGGNGSFAPGDVWKSDSAGLIVGEGRLLVIHTVSDTILLDQPYAIEEDGVDLAVENHPNGNFRSDQATIHGNANWSYDILATLGGTSYEETDNINYTLTFDYQSGTDNGKINWYDDGNHEIEVGSISSQKTVTATATIYRENGIALNETGEVELTVKPEPSFSVSVTDTSVADGSGALSVANQGQFGTQSIGPNELVRGDTLEVTARIENTNPDAAVTTQQIEMGMGPNSGSGNTMSAGPKSATLAGGESTEMTFTMDVPTSAVPGMHTMEVASEDDTDTREIMVNSLPNFEVTGITILNDPLATGGNLNVNAEITNTGTMPDTQEVTVNIGANSNPKSVTIGGGTADKTTTKSFTVTANVPNPGLWPVKVSSNNDSAKKDATILELDIGFGPGTTTEASAGSNENVTLEADVSLPSGTDLDGESVSTTVTLNASSLDSGNFSEDITLSDSNEAETVSRTFTPNYASLDPQSYTVTASEDLTGSGTSTGVTVLAPDIGVSVANAPDSVEVGDGFDVTYEVTNSGNEGQTGDVNLTVTLNDGSVEKVASKSFTLGPSSSDTGTISYSGSDILDDGFGGGDTVEFTLKAEDGTTPPDVLDTATGSVDLTQPSSSILNIDDTNSPVVAGERITATTGVDLTGLTSSLGTQGLGTEQLGPSLSLKLTVLDGNGSTLGTNDTSLLENLGSSLTKTLSVPTSTDDAGNYTAQVELLGLVELSENEPVTVESPNPNLQFDLTNAPNQLTIGSTSDLAVDYSVTNVGNAEASTIIDLSVDKTTGSEDSAALNVAPGEDAGGTLTYSDFASDYGPGETINWDVSLAQYGGSSSGTTDVAGDPASFDVSILGTNNPDAGNKLTVGVQVTNEGDKTGTVDVSMSIPDIGSKTKTMQDVTGGELRTHQFEFSTSSDDAGTHTATADTGDNTATTQVTIDGANIQIVSASGPAQVAPGEDLEIDYTLENVGTKEGTEESVELYIGGTALEYLEDTDSDVTVPADGTESGTLIFDDTSSYSDDETINWTVELFDFGGNTSGNVAVVGSGGGGGGGTASFAVTITGTNSPVKEGNVLDVDVQIDNIGGAQGTQNIDLSTGGLGSASTGVTLGAGESTTETLSVSTSNGDAGDYMASVSSEDTSASTTVTVTTGAAPAQLDVKIDSIAGQSFDPVVEVPTSGTTVDVEYTVENTGGKAGSTDVTLKINGDKVENSNINNPQSITVGPGKNKQGTFSDVPIEDGHLTGSGINIGVVITDDSATETVDTKALRISSHTVESQVHPFLYDNMTTVVRNDGNTEASATLTITDVFDDSSYQSTQSISVEPDAPEWQRTFHVGLDQATAEAMFGETDRVDANISSYKTESLGGDADFDINGEVWVEQSYIDDMYLEDKSEQSVCVPVLGCGAVKINLNLQVGGSSGEVYDPDDKIDTAGFRLLGEGSWLGDITGNSALVKEASVASNTGYENTVTEITGDTHYFDQFAYFFKNSAGDAIEYEWPGVTGFPASTACAITGDQPQSATYGTPGDGLDMGNYHVLPEDDAGDNQCDDLPDDNTWLNP